MAHDPPHSGADPFQTQRQIQALLAGGGLTPKRRFGQHFLVDRNLMMKLIEAAGLSREDVVIEVGTGTGSLTRLVAEQAGVVHTFEIDPQIAEIAEAQLAGARNVVRHRGDALKNKNALSAELAGLLEGAAGVKLVANLPYDAATPLLMALLLARRPPGVMCFTIQREVGSRITAPVGTREYGPVSVLAHLYARTETIARVPPSAFWPRPKVDSAMMRMTPIAAGEGDVARRLAVAGVVRRAFLHRRKTMLHVVSGWAGASEAERALAASGIQRGARPEAVTPAQWAELAGHVPGHAEGTGTQSAGRQRR